MGPVDGDLRGTLVEARRLGEHSKVIRASDKCDRPHCTLVRARTTDVRPLFHCDIKPIDGENPQTHRAIRATSKTPWKVVQQKCDLGYFAHEAQRSVYCSSIYKESGTATGRAAINSGS